MCDTTVWQANYPAQHHWKWAWRSIAPLACLELRVGFGRGLTRLEPVVDRHIQLARWRKTLDLVVPVGGQQQGAPGLDVYCEDMRLSAPSNFKVGANEKVPAS